MKLVIISSPTLFSVVGHAGELRVYQSDSMGDIKYNKPSYVVQENGRIIEVNPAGRIQYHKKQYQIKGQTIYQVNSIGDIKYNKPSYTIQKDGRIIEVNPAGRVQYHKQQYLMKDGKIYQINSTGDIQYHKPQFVIK
jgi:hypothetical protein